MRWRWFLCGALTLFCAFFIRLGVGPAQAQETDPEIRAKEYAKFTLTNQVRVLIEGILAALDIEITSPLSASGSVEVEATRATPRYACTETCATCNHAVTEVAAAFVVPTSSIGTYRITNNGAPVACLAGAAPVAVYATHNQHVDGSEKEIRLPAGSYSCITSAGETSRVTLVPCEPTAEWAVP